MPITVTERAAREVAAIMSSSAEGAEGGAEGGAGADGAGAKTQAMLRIWVAGAGCSGLRYGLGIDDKEPRADDSVFESHGVRVVVDPRSLALMDGSVVTWIEDAENSGFSIENPNPAPAVGCGCSDSGCGSGCGEPGDEAAGADAGKGRGCCG